MTYQTRQTFEEMLKVSPDEDIKTIEAIFESLAKEGFNYFQWSDFSQPTNKPGEYQRFLQENPDYDDMSDAMQTKLFINWSKQQPNWFFMEAFGPQFIRSEAETFLLCAQKIQSNWQTQTNCIEHEYAYTHSNGNKTCKKCGHFTRCTVEEALENYKKGSVKIDKHLVLEFDHEKQLCVCGSHQLYFYPDGFFPEKQFQCVSCKEFVESPHEPLFGRKEDFESCCSRMIVFLKGKKTTKKNIHNRISIFLERMWKHYKYVEKKEDGFLNWVDVYLSRFIHIWNGFLEVEGTTYHLEDAIIVQFNVEEDSINQLELNLKLAPISSDIQSDDDYAKEMLETIFEALVPEE